MSDSWRDKTVTWGELGDRLGVVRDEFDCNLEDEAHGPHLVTTSNYESRVCPGKGEVMSHNEFEIKFKRLYLGTAIATGCLTCGNLVADEDLHRAWHLNPEVKDEPRAEEWFDIRAMTREELENMLNERLQDWQWERVKNYVRYREKR